MLLIVFANTAAAAVLLVTKTADTNDGVCDSDCSLREAVVAASLTNEDDTINFDPTIFSQAATISLNGSEIAVAPAGKLTINGPGSALLTVSGNNASRILLVKPNADLTLIGVRLQSGNGVGSLINGGGAVAVYSSIFTVANCEFSSNSTSVDGGAIYGFFFARVNITNSVLTGNKSRGGGAVMSQGSSSTLSLSGVSLSDNLASGDGGAVYVLQATAVISGTTFRQNHGQGGGAIFNTGSTRLENSLVDSNMGSAGGGVGNTGSVEIVDSHVVNNTSSGEGGGIRSGLGPLTLTRVELNYNRAAMAGGGFLSEGSTATVNDSSVASNSASDGGGIDSDHLVMNGSTVNGNYVSGLGGGMFTSNATIRNSTISGNRAGYSGGAIHAIGGVTLISSTIARNTALIGAGVFHTTGTVTAGNTILADNFTSVNTEEDVYGSLVSSGYNLIESLFNTTLTGDTATCVTGIDPQLLPLRSNGGPTETHGLRRTSPAIDKGNSFGSTTDQRGAVRPFDQMGVPNASDGTDIGAFERQNTDVRELPPFDFDGDGLSDVSVFRPSNGFWYINGSRAGFYGVQFGVATDKIVPADYDGDGLTDIAVYRSGTWFINYSVTRTFSAVQFGLADDTPVPADYDGDGKTDTAVYRPSTGTWWINGSMIGLVSVRYGLPDDIPAVGDYDGDGRADIALFRPSNGNWYQLRSGSGEAVTHFGQMGDRIVPADYDGDGRTDIAVYRPSQRTWFIARSSAGPTSTVFGLPDDIPTPGDFDGDAKSDIAVYRPSDGRWYIIGTTSGFAPVQFGLATDIPTESTFGN